jgi:two-component system OmpR family sensor kinase
MANNKTKNKGSSLQDKRIKIDFLVHDIKSPLAVIETGISLLIRNRSKCGPLTEKQEKILTRTLRNTRVARDLVESIMEMGMAREGVFRYVNCTISGVVLSVLREIFDLVDVDLGEKISDCEGLFSLKDLLKEKGILISVDEGLWSQQIRLDELKVKQIVRNLLNNAMKYRKNLVEIEFIHEGRFLRISVKDDGKGIGIMHHKRIFESYFQVDDADEYGFRSHGLGLAGVMVLIEDMGGELFLESDEGKGTKFIAKVPLPED